MIMLNEPTSLNVWKKALFIACIKLFLYFCKGVNCPSVTKIYKLFLAEKQCLLQNFFGEDAEGVLALEIKIFPFGIWID